MRQLSGSEFQNGVTAWGAISGRAFFDFLGDALHVRKEAANGGDRRAGCQQSLQIQDHVGRYHRENSPP